MLPRVTWVSRKNMKTQNQQTQGQKSTAVSELEAISKRREEVISNVKQMLATSLAEAAGHVKLLQKEGLQSVLSDPQFKESVDALGIVVEEQMPRPERNGTRHSNRKGISFEDAIQKSLADGKSRSVDEIYKRVQQLKGDDASRDTMLAVLSVVRKKGFIKNPSRGQWQRATAA
jgi:hypothetical protein